MKYGNCGYDPDENKGGCPCCNQQTMEQILAELQKLNAQMEDTNKRNVMMLKAIGDTVLIIANHNLLR